MGLEKEYVVKARFGAVSDTLDREGNVIETGRVPEGELKLPTGELEQVPPKFSALHVDGKRAHQLAREGVDFELAPRKVRVDHFEEEARNGASRTFRVRCGSGTYIRSLVADLGDAYSEELRRTAIGPFRLEDAFQESDAQTLDLLDSLSQVMPVVELESEQADALGHGRPVEMAVESRGPVAAVGTSGLVAIAEINDDGLLASSVGFVG